MEAFRCFHRVLTRQTIGDQKRFSRVCDFGDLLDLGHELFIDRGAARRIKKDNIIAAELTLANSAFSNLNGGLIFTDFKEAHTDLFRQNTELLHRSRAARIQRGQKNFFLLLLF